MVKEGVPNAKLCVDVLELRLPTINYQRHSGRGCIWTVKETELWVLSLPPLRTQPTPMSTCQASPFTLWPLKTEIQAELILLPGVHHTTHSTLLAGSRGEEKPHGDPTEVAMWPQQAPPPE